MATLSFLRRIKTPNGTKLSVSLSLSQPSLCFLFTHLSLSLLSLSLSESEGGQEGGGVTAMARQSEALFFLLRSARDRDHGAWTQALQVSEGGERERDMCVCLSGSLIRLSLSSVSLSGSFKRSPST
jgi:hypothetical protein